MFLLKAKHCMWCFTVQDGRTPLLRAAERGHADLVRLLAGHYGGDVFHKLKVHIVYTGFYHTHSHSNPHSVKHTRTSIFQNSQNALHLAAYRGHLPVLQYLCPMFGDRVLDKDGNDESCLDIARRLKRWPIVKFLTQNYPQLEGKVGKKVHTQ